MKLPRVTDSMHHIPHAVGSVRKPHPPAHPVHHAASAPSLPVPSSNAGPTFTAPRPGRSGASLRRHNVQPTLPRRVRRQGPGQVAGSDDPVTTDEPMREQFKLKTLQFDVSMGGSRDGDQQRESDEQARRFAEIARRRHAAASRDQTPERDDLMAAVRGAPSIDALAPLLRSAVVPERKRLAQFFIDVARVWRSSRPVDPVSAPLSLGDVKRALLQPAQPGAPGPAGPAKPQERSAAVNLWLPVFLLNLARPRSPQQQRLAEDRMRMIGRGLSGGAVKAG